MCRWCSTEAEGIPPEDFAVHRHIHCNKLGDKCCGKSCTLEPPPVPPVRAEVTLADVAPAPAPEIVFKKKMSQKEHRAAAAFSRYWFWLCTLVIIVLRRKQWIIHGLLNSVPLNTSLIFNIILMAPTPNNPVPYIIHADNQASFFHDSSISFGSSIIHITLDWCKSQWILKMRRIYIRMDNNVLTSNVMKFTSSSTWIPDW